MASDVKLFTELSTLESSIETSFRSASVSFIDLKHSVHLIGGDNSVRVVIIFRKCITKLGLGDFLLRVGLIPAPHMKIIFSCWYSAPSLNSFHINFRISLSPEAFGELPGSLLAFFLALTQHKVRRTYRRNGCNG